MPARTLTRTRLLLGAALSLVTLLTLATMVEISYPPLLELDERAGDGPQSWTAANDPAYDVLHAIEVAFGTIPLTVATIVVVLVLLARRQVRAAVWTAGVMTGASLTVYFLKRYFQRDRPVWEEPLHELSTFAFPSGHASGIASAMGVAIVLTTIFVRRRSLRRGLVALWLSVAVIVGLDRVLLGVHSVSDVLAGYAVGAFWVLAGVLVFDPSPRRRAAEALTGPVPRGRRLAVVLNPIKVEDVSAFKAMVEHQARGAGWGVPSWHETTVEDPGRSMAESAAVDGADLVLVCGGDGTVRTVCAELAGTGIPVGVIPAGTGNLLARNLDIPLYLEAAVDVALNGQDRAIDLVAVTGDGIGPDEHFMVMGGMGLDAAIMEGAGDAIKARIGWLAYFVSGLRQLRSPSFKVEISVDGEPFTKHRALTVVVGNVGYLTAGIPLLPDATIDDGVLDVVIVSPRRFVSWVPLLWRVLSKHKRVDDQLNRMTGRRVVVRTAHDTARQLDGDTIGPGREIAAECIHGKLLVRVPR
ncbi:MAG TPA: diacylglycerol kinase family protein [Nocardioidaceae bacterium]